MFVTGNNVIDRLDCTLFVSCSDGENTITLKKQTFTLVNAVRSPVCQVVPGCHDIVQKVHNTTKAVNPNRLEEILVQLDIMASVS